MQTKQKVLFHTMTVYALLNDVKLEYVRNIEDTHAEC